MKPALTILDKISGNTLINGALASECMFSTGDHGCDALSATFPIPPREALRVHDRIKLPHVVVHDGAGALWAGRLEDAEITNAGLRIAAYGYWRALSDAPYTALWSDASTQRWRATLDVDGAANNRRPDMHAIDFNNRLYLALNKGATYPNGGGSGVGGLTYETPNGSGRDLLAVSFSYEVKMPANWHVYFQGYQRDFTSGLTYWGPLVCTGAVQTGTVSTSLTARPRCEFTVFNNSGANYTHTGETGDFYVKITGMRLKTTTGTVSTSAIATDLLTFINSINAGQLSTSTALITSNDLDLDNEIYEDALPSDILTRLAGLGSSSGARWETGVDAQQRLYLRPQGTMAREYYLNAKSLNMQRSLAGMFNSAYGVYKDANNNTLRTASNADAQAAQVAGITRRQAVGIDTASLSKAQAYRDIALGDTKTIRPRATIETDVIFTQSNAPAPLWRVKAGDYLTLNNVGVVGSPSALRSRRFRIGRTEYDCMAGVLKIEPAEPAPALDFLVARAAAGVRV